MEKSLIQGSASTIFSSQPASQLESQSNISFLFSGGLEGTFFSTREHLSNQARQITRERSIFNVPRENILNVLGQHLLFTFTKALDQLY